METIFWLITDMIFGAILYRMFLSKELPKYTYIVTILIENYSQEVYLSTVIANEYRSKEQLIEILSQWSAPFYECETGELQRPLGIYRKNAPQQKVHIYYRRVN